jgi:hypothetical protein
MISAAFSVLLFAANAALFSQSTSVGESCDLGVIGAKDIKSFRTFDREVRSAITNHDAGKIALLVRYPLRIKDSQGSYYIKDAASLQGRFDAIFPDAIRRAIIEQQFENIGCNWAGIMYGNGKVWVNVGDHGYAIVAVNIPAASRQNKSGRVLFACRADQYRVIVDIGGDEKPRYRVWENMRSIVEHPDLEIAGGKEAIEGTGSCAHTIWTFKNGTRLTTVEELGCFPDSNQPPETATGQLIISPGEKEEKWWWCF